MKFPPVIVNSYSVSIMFMFDRIFGEENSVEYIEKVDDTFHVHFNQSLPMTPEVQTFYETIKKREVVLDIL